VNNVNHVNCVKTFKSVSGCLPREATGVDALAVHRSRSCRSLLTLLPFLVVLATSQRAGAQSDSISRRPLFTAGDALLAGGVLVGARLIHPLDERYRLRLQDSSTQANRRLQTISKLVRTTAAPGAYIIGGTLYAVGRVGGNEKLADLGLHGTEALALGELVATGMKIMVGRARPYVGKGPDDYGFMRGLDKGDYKSFPSGHTVSAFAAAAAVTSEVSRMAPGRARWAVGSVLFTGAGLVGASRMYNNQHWASDVIVGAGIGTFAGLKIVRFHHSHPGNRIDRWLLAGSLVPNGNGGQSLRFSVMPGGLPLPPRVAP
jgi:membrane-associated phospholipid phosphatase